jgi:hypothetical protein
VVGAANHLGGFLFAISGVPVGRIGEARELDVEAHPAASLFGRLGRDVVLLHEREIVGTDAAIGHIAVAPSGVWVIDTKRCTGRVEIKRPLFGPSKLTIDGRDQTQLINGLSTEVETMRAVAGKLHPAVDVHGALCFIDADLPLFSTLEFGGFPLLHPRRLAKRINADGALGPREIAAVAGDLAACFPAA